MRKRTLLAASAFLLAAPAAAQSRPITAVDSALVGRVLDGREGQPAFKLNPAVLPFTDLLAKLDGSAAEFNSAVKAYQELSSLSTNDQDKPYLDAKVEQIKSRL